MFKNYFYPFKIVPVITINGNQSADAENNLLKLICNNINVRYDFYII
jgi:hypothetical protein